MHLDSVSKMHSARQFALRGRLQVVRFPGKSPACPARIDPSFDHEQLGVSLVEVLIGAVVFVTMSLLATVLFNSTIKQLYGQGAQGKANAAINSDIAKIKKMAEEYNACSSPSGSTTPCPSTNKWPDGTTSVGIGDSFYYHPNDFVTAGGSGDQFLAACKSSSASSHITSNLIAAINGLPKGDLQNAGVSRADAVRYIDSSDGEPWDSRIIVVQYSTLGGLKRTLEVYPVVSAWCS